MNRYTLLHLCDLIEAGYAEDKSGGDDDMHQHLIDLGDQTQAIRDVVAVLRDAREAMLDDRLDDLRGILAGDVCADALAAAGVAQ